MKFGSILFVVAVAGCADSDGGKQATPPEDINVIWDLDSQTCDGAALAAGTTLYYKFDKDHVVRVDMKSDTDQMQCLTGYVYSQIVTSSSPGAEYRSSATLSAAGTKTQCWMKQNGMKVEPPTNETGTFGPETLSMMMVATNDTVALDLGHAPGCKTGTLHVELTKR